MNEENRTLVITDTNPENDVPVEHQEAEPKDASFGTNEQTQESNDNESSKEDDTDKKSVKLKALKKRYDNAVSAQESAEKRKKDIKAQIDKLEKQIHSDEIAELDNACGKKKITYKQIIELIWAIPEGVEIEEIKKMLEKRSADNI